MSASKRIPVAEINREKPVIFLFVVDAIRAKPGARLHMTEVFEAYQTYRAARKLPPTVLSIDGFGRLFPDAFPRKVMSVNGLTARGICDIALERA